jgi:hypothetical protein
MEMWEVEVVTRGVVAETTTEVVVIVVPMCLVEVTSRKSIEMAVAIEVEVEVIGATTVLREVTITPSVSVEYMVEVSSMVWTKMLFSSTEGVSSEAGP